MNKTFAYSVKLFGCIFDIPCFTFGTICLVIKNFIFTFHLTDYFEQNLEHNHLFSPILLIDINGKLWNGGYDTVSIFFL